VNDADRRRWSDGFDDDAVFADIVAHLNDDPPQEPAVAEAGAQEGTTDLDRTDTAADQSPADPSAETTSEPTDLAPGDRPQPPTGQWRINPPPWLPARSEPQADPPTGPHTDPHTGPQAVPAPQSWRGHEVDDDEDHFEPPPVSPLPAGDLQFWAIIVGMCGGPLLLLYLVLFNRDASSYWILIAITMSVGGFALLVSRIPGHHGDDDDGARL
jgi:hypothetical protein